MEKDDEVINLQKQIFEIAASQRGSNVLHLSDTRLRYVTKEQATEWIRMGTFENVHTKSPELSLIAANLARIGHILPHNISIVDLGCGDGKKIPPLIAAISQKSSVRDFFGC